MRYFLRCALFLALVSPAVSPALQGTDATSLLALHRAYVGWQFGDGTFTSLRETGNLVNTTPEAGSTPRPPAPMQRLVRGVVYRETATDVDTGRRYDDGFTGHLFWESNNNGFTHPVIGDLAKYDVSEQFLFNEATTQLAGTSQPAVTIGGTSYPVVRVTPSSGFPIDLAIDPRTGAYVRATIDRGGSYETAVNIVSYGEPLPGKRLVAAWRYDDSHYTHTFTSIQPNAPISDDELHPPPQTAAWTFSNPSPFPITTHGDQILVPAVVNGVAGTFLFDTGASNIVLMADFAARAHVRRAASAAINGIGGTASAEDDVIDKIVVGGNTLSNVLAISAGMGNDYRGVTGGGVNGQRIDGILGYDLMGGAVVKVNMGASTMTIFDPATADLSSEQGIPLNVDLSSGQPAIPMTLNGSIDLNAVLDTGDAVGIGFSSALIFKYHLAFMRAPAYIEGVSGVEATNCGALGKLQVGPISYDNEIACETGALDTNQLLVGIDFLKHFNMLFDYPRGLLILEPIP